MIDDIRVLMIIIAHCLANCRHLNEVDGNIIANPEDSDEARNKKSLERFFENTKYLIIPITHRLGLYNIKKELEEALMIYENPKEYYEIKNKITESKVKQEETLPG